MQIPISVTAPSFISKEQGTAALGAAGGILFSDFMASMVVGRFALAGGTALATAALAKGALGAAGFWVAGKTTGLARTGLWLASVGAFASIALDVIKTYVWPAGEAAAARLRASYRAPVFAPPVVRVPPMVQGRAETPSGQALGGF